MLRIESTLDQSQRSLFNKFVHSFEETFQPVCRGGALQQSESDAILKFLVCKACLLECWLGCRIPTSEEFATGNEAQVYAVFYVAYTWVCRQINRSPHPMFERSLCTGTPGIST